MDNRLPGPVCIRNLDVDAQLGVSTGRLVRQPGREVPQLIMTTDVDPADLAGPTDPGIAPRVLA